MEEKAKAEEKAVPYKVMDKTVGERPNTHDFIDPRGKIVPFTFERGKPLSVPEYVAKRCAAINKDQPNNPPFVVTVGDNLELDEDVFDEMTLEALLKQVELSLPNEAAAIQKKLDTFMERVQRQLEQASKGADEDAEKIVQLTGELKLLKEGGNVGGATPAALKPGTVVAAYEDLIQPALVLIAKARPGGEKLKANPSKQDCIDFLMASDQPVAGGEAKDPVEVV